MIDETSERLAIEALVAEFAWRIDHGEAARVPELFTQDGRFAVPGSAVEGQDQLTEAFSARERQSHTTRHVCTNLRLEILAEDRARGTVLVTLYRHDRERLGELMPFAVNDYEDRYERGVDERWRFAERCVVPIFTRPAAEEDAAPENRSSRTRRA